MTETAQFLLAIGATGAVCALWAWLQLQNAGNRAGDDAAAPCGLDGCDVCRGVCQASPAEEGEAAPGASR